MLHMVRHHGVTAGYLIMHEQSTLYVQILVLINTTLTLRSKVFNVVVVLNRGDAVLVRLLY